LCPRNFPELPGIGVSPELKAAVHGIVSPELPGIDGIDAVVYNFFLCLIKKLEVLASLLQFP